MDAICKGEGQEDLCRVCLQHHWVAVPSFLVSRRDSPGGIALMDLSDCAFAMLDAGGIDESRTDFTFSFPNNKASGTDALLPYEVSLMDLRCRGPFLRVLWSSCPSSPVLEHSLTLSCAGCTQMSLQRKRLPELPLPATAMTPCCLNPPCCYLESTTP